MKKFFLLGLIGLMGLLGNSVQAQMAIPGTTVSFTLPADEWSYVRTFTLDDGASVYLYSYVGETLVEATGDTALPFLRIYVNPKYSGDIYSLAYDRYVAQPFQSLTEYTKGDGLPRGGGLGYEGIYTNPADGKDYRILMTYFKERRTAVEFRLETSRGTYDRMESRFKEILKSVK